MTDYDEIRQTIECLLAYVNEGNLFVGGYDLQETINQRPRKADTDEWVLFVFTDARTTEEMIKDIQLRVEKVIIVVLFDNEQKYIRISKESTPGTISDFITNHYEIRREIDGRTFTYQLSEFDDDLQVDNHYRAVLIEKS